MRANHVAVFVGDLEKTREFYEKYFDATSNAQYHNPKMGLRAHFLHFEDDGMLEIMPKLELSEIGIHGEFLGYTHIAFSAESKTAVELLTERLSSDGFTVFSEPRTTGDGYCESCVSDPDGNRIEIVAQ